MLKSIVLVLLLLPTGIDSWMHSFDSIRSPDNSGRSPDLEQKFAQATASDSVPTILAQSWTFYRQRFIQTDGRVIDWEHDERTVSEGQAYAMLRSVLADDPATFALTLNWAEKNLRRQTETGEAIDSLWAWHWGKQAEWGILDQNFASDADLDAATALILASRRWNRPDYLELARTKLNDLWRLSTVTADADRNSSRYFLPGPIASFQPRPDQIYLNPSYFAPASFRLFAQVDPQHDWLSLVDSSYQVLQASSQISAVQLPSDWIQLDLKTGQFTAPPVAARLRPTYSFDAYRVWWRVALDAVWFDEAKAKSFLQTHLEHLRELWQEHQKIPARISSRGAVTASYEATSQYAMLYPAFQVTDPAIAAQLREKLLATYKDGFWDNDSAYYVQNLAWLGLYPAADLPRSWLQPR